MIFTFYSYKGGVGRSMALANVAEWFYLQGARVLMIDWDLEAPGLESFFYQTEKDLDGVRAKRGLIDLLLHYRKEYAVAARATESRGPDAVRNAAISTLNLEDWLHPIHAPDSGRSRARGLWLLPAGLRHERFAEYAESVHDFNWAELYDDYEGEAFFEWLRAQVAPTFKDHQLVEPGFTDVVLIDSRTGITEMGGICTQEFADVVVAFTAPNLQNLLGVETMARSFRRKEILDSRNGKPDVIIVPSRVDSSELESRNRFEQRLRDIEPLFIPPILQSLKRSFWDLKIPYVPKFAYEEALTIWAGSSKARYIEAEEIAKAYRQVAATMVMLTPTTHRLRAYAVQDTATLFEKKRVYLTVAGMAGIALAARVRKKMETEAPDIDLWLPPRESAVSGCEAQATQEIAASSSLLLAITPEALESDGVRREWQQARRNGICVYGVYEGGSSPTVPRWMRKTKLFDLDQDWTNLLQALRSPCAALRAPFMAPDLPSTYVARTKILDRVRASIVSGTGARTGVRCVLQGMGGSGKSVVAAALCHDPIVVDAFDDGILWFSLGQKPEIQECMTQLYAALTGERKSFANEQDALYQLGLRLNGLTCLIVLDDVWQPADVDRFQQAGKNSAWLITSRNVAVAADAVAVDVGGMSVDDAAQLLGEGLDVTNPALLRELADQFGRLPLALAIGRALLLERVRSGESLERACQYLLQLIVRKGFEDFGSLNETIAASVSRLSEEGRERFRMLAVFPENERIPISSAAALWIMDEFDAEDQVQHFARLSLLEFDLASRMLSIHPVIRSYLQAAPHTAVSASEIVAPGIDGREWTLITLEYQRDRFRFSIVSDTSGVTGRAASVDPNLLFELNKQLLTTTALKDQVEIGKALYQLLFRSGLDAHISPDRPLVMLTQGRAGEIGWEMLIPSRSGEPLGIEPGLSRTVSGLSRLARQRTSGDGLSVLLIADAILPSRPDAREEVEQLWQMFAGAGCHVTALVGPEQTTRVAVLTSILARDYDIVHFAGHHVADPSDPAVPGWAFDKGTIGPNEFAQLDRAPRLIVANLAAPRLLASTAEGFLRHGVASCVVSPPPVDGSPVRFSVEMYRELLYGIPIYVALRIARQRLLANGVQGWGLYQHYGDPFFRL